MDKWKNLEGKENMGNVLGVGACLGIGMLKMGIIWGKMEVY